MDTNEILTPEEVVETAEELAEVGKSFAGVKIAVGVGVAAICVFLGYRFVAKPIIAKIRQKKMDESAKMVDTTAEECEKGESRTE